jgi:hypothetical protein
MLYGGIGIYTSYKNLESIEAKITGFDQEIYAYNDLYGLIKKLNKTITIPVSLVPITTVSHCTSPVVPSLVKESETLIPVPSLVTTESETLIPVPLLVTTTESDVKKETDQ